MMRPTAILGFAALGLALVGFVTGQATVQAPTRQPTVAVGDPAAEIAALRKSVTALEAAVRVLETKTQLVTSDGRSYTINAPGNIQVTSGQNTTITVGQNATLKSQMGLAMTGGTTVSVKAPGGSVSASPASLQLVGTMVQINGGGMPAARVGSQVSGAQVTTGSATVLIGG